jgi:glycosyltransferase involved in cell wall biosynthesis
VTTRGRVTIQAINYPPEPTGNAPYSGALARGLADRGFDVDVITAHPHYPAWRIADGYGERTRDERIDGIPVRRLRHYVPNPPRGLRRLRSELSFGRRLLTTRRRQADVLVALHPALFASWIWSWRQRRTPRVHWVQDIYQLGLAEIGEGSGLAARITRWVERRTLRSAARVVVIHERFKSRLIELYGLDPGRIAVIRNWTYVEAATAIDRPTARAELGWGEETVVLYTGNFGAKQGLELVVAAARLADVREAPIRFVLMGGGGEEAALRALAADGASAVKRLDFLGPQPGDRFTAALAAADVLLVCEKPGVAESSVPSKMATYFAAGRPVLAVGTPDGITADEMARAGAGLAIAAGDPAALLTAALDLGSDPERARLLGEQGRRYRDAELAPEVALDRWAALLDSPGEERGKAVS